VSVVSGLQRRPQPESSVPTAGLACTVHSAGDLISRLVWSSPPERLSPGDSGTTAPGLLFEDRLLLGSAIGFQLQPPLCREPIFADGLCLGDIGQEFLLECVSHNAEFSPVLELGAPAYGLYCRPRRRLRCDQNEAGHRHVDCPPRAPARRFAPAHSRSSGSTRRGSRSGPRRSGGRVAERSDSSWIVWLGWRDLNSRPLDPQTSAACPRTSSCVQFSLKIRILHLGVFRWTNPNGGQNGGQTHNQAKRKGLIGSRACIAWPVSRHS
jgi:hypothetical protein